MQEIIHKIDNWTLIKLLGGIAIVLTAIIGFFSKYLLNKLSQSSQHIYDKKLEDLKGEIVKSNAILNSMVQNHFSSSQKILDKKIQAYELLWSSILGVKEWFPAGISLVYHLLVDSEIEKDDAFESLDNNPNMSPVLRSYDMDRQMEKLVNNGNALVAVKPYLTDKSYKLYYTYQGLIGRVTHQFIFDYKKKKLYNWKKDKGLETILKTTLTSKELEYINGIYLNALKSLMDLLEYKILQDFRQSLNIKDSANDTIEYLKDIEKIFSERK